MNSLSYDLDYNGTPNYVYINAAIRNGKIFLRECSTIFAG